MQLGGGMFFYLNFIFIICMPSVNVLKRISRPLIAQRSLKKVNKACAAKVAVLSLAAGQNSKYIHVPLSSRRR